MSIRIGAIIPAIADQLAGERDRWAPWLPVGLGAGIGLYFALPFEPPPWFGPAALAAVMGLGYLVRRRPAWLMLTIATGLICAGFAVAQWRTFSVAAPMLTERLGPTGISGRVIRIEAFPKGARVTLEKPRISRLQPNLTPERIRLRLRGPQPAINPGDWVRLRAMVMPPSPPAAPGAFDFQRQSFFRRLGGVGFALGPAQVLAPSGGGGWDGLLLGLARLRQGIAARVKAGLDGIPGAIAAALMTGDRSAIPKETMATMRDSGLAHLLAISGLHMGLVAGILFVSLRGGLALVGPLALGFPIKKWAAAAAILGAFAYGMVAGATVPTQRAFLMIFLVLAAVLFDRRGISMRTVAWAAVIVLLFRPESLLGPSFQLSFAAVVALIATYEAVRDRRRRDGPLGWRRRIVLYIGGVALTTLVAGMATAPFAAYHFNRFADYGLAANLIAVPVTALWTMPWAVVAFALMPFGLESLALAPMGWGVGVMTAAADTVSSWPGAVTLLPAMPMWGLGGDRARRAVAVPMAPTLADVGPGGHGRRPGQRRPGAAAGHPYRRPGQTLGRQDRRGPGPVEAAGGVLRRRYMAASRRPGGRALARR
jgi:competence protein ComEC